MIETVTQAAQWGRKLPPGRGLGLAAHRCEYSYAAAVVEVAVSTHGELQVPRVDIAIDCGPQVNPERVRAQMEGAVMWGLSLAISGEITFENGRVQQSNFHQYPLLRMKESPLAIHVHPVGATDFTVPLGGVGEPGVPPIAPALLNAIFAATGRRIRALPIGRQLANV